MIESESADYFKITVGAQNDYDQTDAQVEVSHSPDEDEDMIGLSMTLPSAKQFDSVHMTAEAAEKLRDALTAALEYREANR